jgi:diguanylate cyclase
MLLALSTRLLFALHDARRTGAVLLRSHTDEVTGLPNRGGLRERLDGSIARGAPFALAVLDLNGFKDINETLGRATGDDVLKSVGTRIRQTVPALATVAGLGGDKFGILIPRGDSTAMATIAADVLEALGEPLRVASIDITMSASVGIVEWADETVDGSELLRRAEVAKDRGKDIRPSIVRYDPMNDDFASSRLRITEELRHALVNGELEVWYQPQIDASTMRPCALEALVRWRHPVQGLLTPVAFLPAARRAGLMPALSQEVARLAIADIARWRAVGLQPRVAINCAPPELLSGVFLPNLHAALADAGLPPDSLVLEVTEESFMSEPERARQLLEEIREQGVQISIDDYGTGFSSLAYLRDLPVDELKVDRSFVQSIRTDERSRVIVASTIQLARALGLRTVAEGVEDAPTAAELVAMGVTALQGYHIARPMPAAEVLDWTVQSTALSDGWRQADVFRP